MKEASFIDGKKMIAHNVYFTLQDGSDEAQTQMAAACHQYLSGHAGEVYFAVGKRKTEFTREVNDLDFHICLNIVFEDQKSHDEYQQAERHFQFIDENKDKWKHVRVFDSVLIK